MVSFFLLSSLVALLVVCSACGVAASVEARRELASPTEVPIVGGVSPTSAVVGFRTDASASIQVKYADNDNFQNSLTTAAVQTIQSSDFTGNVNLTGLAPDTTYTYRLLVDGNEVDPVQTFTTFPDPGGICKVAVFADVEPADRRARVYSRGKDDGARIALQIGDFDHTDNVRGLDLLRSMHRKIRDPNMLHGAHFVDNIVSQMPVDHVWDDWDYCGNDEDRNCPTKNAALQAYDEYYPGYHRPSNAGIWHKFTFCDAEFFMLDTRSHRDPDNQPDSETKTMLGAEQKAWLEQGLLTSTATWKIVVSTQTLNQYARPARTNLWMTGFANEAGKIKDFIANNNLTNVVVLSGDIHTGGGVDDGTNSGWDAPEMTVPHTNLVNSKGSTDNNSGVWSEGFTAGKGGNNGYGLVTIGPTSLKLEAKDKRGNVRHSLTLASP